MITLHSHKDQKILDTLRYKPGHNPFSFRFDPIAQQKLLAKATQANADISTLNVINAGFYFHKVHTQLFHQLTQVVSKTGLSNKALVEVFISFMNEQEILLREKKDEHYESLEELSAFANQTAATRPDKLSARGQNFSDLSEAIVEIGNIIISYLFHSSQKVEVTTSPLSQEMLLNLVAEMFKIGNKYYALKVNYDACIFSDGDIEIDDNYIFFDACLNDFYLVNAISDTILENQRLNRLHYFYLHSKYTTLAKQIVLDTAATLILSDAVIKNNFIEYELRRRNPEDYSIYLDYLTSLTDYYPFYAQKPLTLLASLTITDLLKLNCELANLGSKLYFGVFRKVQSFDVDLFKGTYLPKIPCAVLKSYLSSVTKATEYQVDTFLNLVTWNKDSAVDFFNTPLIKEADHYLFPYYSLIHPNYLHLIDYWLEKSNETLQARGTAFENYIKEQLQSIPTTELNKFRLIQQKKFALPDRFEEIDLLIETSTTLIIAEVKCVKYPMDNRGYYRILNDVVKEAALQLNRKSEFLSKNKDYFNCFSPGEKKIVNAIILNYPYFVSCTYDDIPIIDANFFLSYFKSGKMVSRKFNKKEMEEVEEVRYYSNHAEFCSNFDSYLRNHPMALYYNSRFTKGKSSIKFEGLPEVFFTDIVENS